jgi:hypothetical protein
VDAIGPIFILIEKKIYIYIYTNNFKKNVYCYFSAISAKVPLQFPAVNNFFLPLYLTFFAEFSAIWQQWIQFKKIEYRPMAY